MSSPDFQHLRLSMVKDVAVVEIRTRDLQGPMLAQELGTELAPVTSQDGPAGSWSTSAGPPTSAARASRHCSRS